MAKSFYTSYAFLFASLGITAGLGASLVYMYNNLGSYTQTRLQQSLLKAPQTLLDYSQSPARVKEYVIHIQKGREASRQEPELAITAPSYDAFTG